MRTSAPGPLPRRPSGGHLEARDRRPIIALCEDPGVKRGDHDPPTGEHGEWAFAEAGAKRKAY